MDVSSCLDVGEVLALLVGANYFSIVPSPSAAGLRALPAVSVPSRGRSFVSSGFFRPPPLLPLLRWFFSQLFTAIVLKLFPNESVINANMFAYLFFFVN